MTHHHLSRRRFVAGTSAAGLSAIGARELLAQEATPASDATGETEGSPAATPAVAGPAIPPEYNDPQNWPNENYDLPATRNPQETSISTETISQLGVAWRVPVSVSAPYGSLTGNPVVIGDTVFIQDAKSNVYAYDKATGEEVWINTYDVDVPAGGPNGIAVGYGIAVFPLGGSGDVVAVQVGNGEELWRTNILGPLNEGITMAPLIYDSVVYISTIPGSPEGFYEGGQRGVFYAMDVTTGQVIWYWETVNDNLWGHPRVNSGGGLWHPPSVDDEGNLYLAIANASPYPGNEEWPNTSSRPGENPYTNYLVSLDSETAETNWGFSITGHDPFDHDNQLTPIITNVAIDGVDTKLVLDSGKHGFAVGVDAETGEELWRTAVGKHQNNDLEEIPEGEEVEIFPGTLGGVETPMAYADGVLYLPVVNSPSIFTSTDSTSGSEALGEPGTNGEMVAVDVTNGEILWSVETPSILLGGATVTNDIVFSAGVDGVVRGWRISDGEEVFAFQAGAGINTSLAVSGDYLFVPAGTFIVPEEGQEAPEELSQELIALKIGGEVQATPEASPVS